MLRTSAWSLCEMGNGIQQWVVSTGGNAEHLDTITYTHGHLLGVELVNACAICSHVWIRTVCKGLHAGLVTRTCPPSAGQEVMLGHGLRKYKDQLCTVKNDPSPPPKKKNKEKKK